MPPAAGVLVERPRWLGSATVVEVVGALDEPPESHPDNAKASVADASSATTRVAFHRCAMRVAPSRDAPVANRAGYRRPPARARNRPVSARAGADARPGAGHGRWPSGPGVLRSTDRSPRLRARRARRARARRPRRWASG